MTPYKNSRGIYIYLEMEEENNNPSQIILNDEKFTSLRVKMAIANKKYKNTIKGKARTKMDFV